MSDEQLFTELTPQEAAAIEGGYDVAFESLNAIQLSGRSDNISLRVDGIEVYGDRITRRDPPLIDLVNNLAPITGQEGSITITLWDDNLGSARDNLIGAVTEDGVIPGTKTVDLFGSNSQYQLTYTVS